MIDPEGREKKRQQLADTAEQIKNHRRATAVERVYVPRQPAHGVPAGAKEDLYDFAAGCIERRPLLYLEFGVFAGKSMESMIRRFQGVDDRFFGFDSFEGLPEAWKEMRQGTFDRRGRIPNISDSRVTFIKGWFQNTLPGFLETLDLHVGRSVLVHLDADLYSSTLFILTSLWPKITEYYFVFDEFMDEEIIAFDDFAQAFPFDYEFLSQTNVGKFPTQIFGRLQRKPLVIGRVDTE